ncbi:MAG: four helix bundle protein [Acidobacteriia bacterium]|nr:four helix bundle protein [Terriglobia bacterium]
MQRFEDLPSWRKARQLAKAVYDLTEQPRFAKDFRLWDQIQGVRVV